MTSSRSAERATGNVRIHRMVLAALLTTAAAAGSAPRVAWAEPPPGAGSLAPPAAGYGVGGGYEFTYTTVARVLDLAVGVAFSSDRFATSEKGLSTQSGTTSTYDSTRVIQESAFLLTQTAAVRLGPVRPFVMI